MRAGATAVLFLVCVVIATEAFAYPWTITVEGVVTGTTGLNDTALLFGAPIDSLIGAPYVHTITTDPKLNGLDKFNSTINDSYGGTHWGVAGAPYSFAVTLNGITFAHDEFAPFLMRSYLYRTRVPDFNEQIYQEAQSEGCAIAYGQLRLVIRPCLQPGHGVAGQP